MLIDINVYVNGKASSQQEVISSSVLRESKVMHGFLTAWEVGTPNSQAVQGSTVVYFL